MSFNFFFQQNFIMVWIMSKCLFSLQDLAFQQVVRVLMSFKASSCEEAVKTLNDDEVDFLMKYIYRAFESPSDNNVLLLTWHEKVCWIDAVRLLRARIFEFQRLFGGVIQLQFAVIHKRFKFIYEIMNALINEEVLNSGFCFTRSSQAWRNKNIICYAS